MTFIIHFKDGHMETYSNHYDENDEHERDGAWDGKPVVDGSDYCKEHKDMEERQCQR